MKRLLLIGGGHSHVEVLRRFAQRPEPGVELLLATPYPFAMYSGMLPGLIAGHYRLEECQIDLVALARAARARFVQTLVNGLQLDAKLAFCASGRTLRYDFASIDIGSRPDVLDVPGAADHALAVKPAERFIEQWCELVRGAPALPERWRLLVVGGGAAGVETLLSMQRCLRRAGARHLQCALVTDTPEVLQSHSPRVRQIFARVLEQRGVEVHAGRRVVEVRKRAVLRTDGSEVAADLIVWATGASAPFWPRACGFVTDARGFIRVNASLQALDRPEIFAAGDIAEMDSARPKSGVYAVRQGPALGENLRRALRGEPLSAYRPQRHALAIISTGERHAVASRGALAVAGAWVWRWKNWIDRRFVRRYACV
ncbi:MAG: FAD-dependent oxidoreductase [Burkholderiales bacterium]